MIIVAYGSEIVKNTYDALMASDIRSYLKHGMDISIKPNLVLARPAADGATTYPEVAT